MLYKQIVLEWGRDTETGVWGKGYSPDNGEHFYVTDTTFGRKYRSTDADGLWNNGLHKKVNQEITNTVEPAIKQADSAVAYANEAIQKSRVNSQAIVEINSAVSDAVSDAAVARSDGLRAWNAAQSNVDLIDQNYASASAAISSARAEAIAAADEAKASASAAQADIVAVQADVTANKSGVAATKSDIAVLQLRTDGFDTKFADTVGNINTLKVDASGMKQTLIDAKGDISTLQAAATGFKNTLTDAQGNISTLQSDVAGLKKTTSDHAGNIATLQADAKTLTSQMADAQGNISTLQQAASGFSSKVSGMETSLANANSKLDGMKIGTRNLLHHSDTFDGWYKGNLVTITSDKYLNGTIAVLGNTGINGGSQIEAFLDGPYDNQPVTWTVYAKADNAGDKLHTELWGGGGLTEQPLTTEWKVYKFTGHRVTNHPDFYLWGCIGNKGNIYVALPFAVVGNTIGTWSPNPTDIADKITANTTATEQNKKAIALKADQTTVDKTNETVQQLQSQLNVQADQIATKVSSSDLDAKGYVTQTYTQTQIKQTADSWNANLTSVKNELTDKYTNLHATVDGIQAQVYNSDGSSKITLLSDLIATKVSQGDYNSQITQLQNDINLRVSKGDVISQINQEAGGNTLIQVSNGKGSLILDAGNTIVTGKAWIPSAAIANLTADDIKTGTLTGSTVHLDDGNGNMIDLGDLATDYVGFHSKATNGDQTYIGRNGIHNYGATYDTKISQGMITTNLLAVNGGGLIDFRSSGSGITIDSQNIKFYNSNAVNGGIEFSGGSPLATVRNGTVGNELRVRYDRSFALTPITDESARICASSAAMQVGFIQSGSSTPDRQTTGLWVDNDRRHVNLGVWGADSTWARVEANTHNIHMQADKAHAWLSSDNVFRIYKDGDSSSTAIKLQVDGWAWINGWVEAAGHSQRSALSTKTEIQPVDDDKMLKMVNDTDLATFLYKTDVANGETHRHIGLIIDDVHDVAQYQTPQEFIAPNGVSRDDDNMIGALFGAVKALTKRIKTLESKVG